MIKCGLRFIMLAKRLLETILHIMSPPDPSSIAPVASRRSTGETAAASRLVG
jgi:hypothetical protein